jgi:hypothetical protein
LRSIRFIFDGVKDGLDAVLTLCSGWCWLAVKTARSVMKTANGENLRVHGAK